MSQQQITVMWVPGAEDGGAMTRVISVPMFNSSLFGRLGGRTAANNAPYNTYNIPVPDTAKVTWLRDLSAGGGNVASPNVLQKTVSTPSTFRFSKANALVVAIIGSSSPTFTSNPSLLYGPSVSLTGATKIFDGTGITNSANVYMTAIPTITDSQLPNKYLLLTTPTSTSARMKTSVVIEDDNPIRG